jgi:hypothetical protein
MPLDAEQDARLRAEMEQLRPLLAMASDDTRIRLLDHAFTLIGHDPDLATWRYYAALYVPEQRPATSPPQS